MTENQATPGSSGRPPRAVENMHQLFLEALRHREQEIFHYLAILGPALGGFVWLLYTGSAGAQRVDDAPLAVAPGGLSVGVFVVGTVTVLLLLLLGAVYSLALGYNYRYITLQLAKLEGRFQIKQYMLEGWPRSRRQFLARHQASRTIPRFIRRSGFGSLQRRSSYRRLRNIPWCTPPEIIKVFWHGFLIALLGVALAASIYRPHALVLLTVIPLGVMCLFIGGCFFPHHYGRKLRKQCRQEPKSWGPDALDAPGIRGT